jgi:hypothetical protein
MTTGNCKYEAGIVDSCFDCKCDECAESVALYEEYLNDKAKEEDYNNIVKFQGGCNE